MRHFWESARYVSARRNSVFRLPLANRIRTRCGGTVTVRFRFSFYPRFGGLFFSFSLCFFSLALVTWGGTKRERRDCVAGCAKGVNRTTWLPRAMHGGDSPGRFARHSIFSETKFYGSHFYRNYAPRNACRIISETEVIIVEWIFYLCTMLRIFFFSLSSFQKH